jgi:hypothetical protein
MKFARLRLDFTPCPRYNGGMRFLRSNKPLPTIALALRVSALYMMLYVGLLLGFEPSGPSAIETIVGLMPIVVGSIATGMAWFAWRASHPLQKRAWLWLFFGLALWTFAEVSYPMASWLGLDLLYNLADFLWLAGYFPMGVACIVFLRVNRFELTPMKEVIAVIGGGLIPMLTFVNFVHPFRGPTLIEVPPDLVIGALYPALDILLATGGLLCLMISGPKPWRRPWFYIGGSLFIFAYTDLWYWLLEFFGINDVSVASAIRVDVPYGLAYIVMAVGCWQVVAEERASKTRPISDIPHPPIS